MMKYLKFPVAVAALATAGTALAADLRVDVVQSEEAPVYLALYDNAEGFEQRDGFRLAVVKHWVQQPSVAFTDLAAGRYVVAVFQDLNGNGELDTNLLGVPTEPYGFSRNAMGNMGPPAFSDAAIALDGQSQAITIELRN